MEMKSPDLTRVFAPWITRHMHRSVVESSPMMKFAHFSWIRSPAVHASTSSWTAVIMALVAIFGINTRISVFFYRRHPRVTRCGAHYSAPTFRVNTPKLPVKSIWLADAVMNKHLQTLISIMHLPAHSLTRYSRFFAQIKPRFAPIHGALFSAMSAILCV